jgi:hypothetical protein
MNNNINKELALHSMMNLMSALAECGVSSTLEETEEGLLLMSADLWNCEDGSVITLSAAADPDCDYEIEIIAEPHPEEQYSLIFDEEE